VAELLGSTERQGRRGAAVLGDGHGGELGHALGKKNRGAGKGRRRGGRERGTAGGYPLIGGGRRRRSSPRRIDGVGCARQLLPAGGGRTMEGMSGWACVGLRPGREREESWARFSPKQRREYFFCFKLFSSF
jgi:hypothetical protein